MKVESVVVGVLAASIAAMTESRRAIADEYWMHDFVAVTMAFDGAWGVGIDPRVHRAIATAVANCKAMSAQQIGFTREQELRERYNPAMPPCVRAVVVSPGGTIVPSPTLNVQSKRAPSVMQVAAAAGTDDLTTELATGDDLMKECRAAISPTPATLGDNPVQSSLRLGLCIGVVSAVYTIARNERLICIPNVAVPTLQVIRVVVGFVEARPQRLHEPFVLLAYDAVADAWPCRP